VGKASAHTWVEGTSAEDTWLEVRTLEVARKVEERTWAAYTEEDKPALLLTPKVLPEPAACR